MSPRLQDPGAHLVTSFPQSEQAHTGAASTDPACHPFQALCLGGESRNQGGTEPYKEQMGHHHPHQCPLPRLSLESMTPTPDSARTVLGSSLQVRTGHWHWQGCAQTP